MAQGLSSLIRQLPVVFATGCAVVAVLGTFEASISRALWMKPEHERVIHVTGFSVPSEETGDYLVYTDAGVYAVDEHLRQTKFPDDPWFLFAIGGTYRVRTRGDSAHGVFGVSRPVISAAQPVPTTRVAGLTATE